MVERSCSLAFVIVALVGAPLLALAAPTDLDPAFGDGGIARLPAATRIDGGALFPDGGLAILTDRPTEPQPDLGIRSIVIRLDPSGRVDSTFAPITSLPPQPLHIGRPYFRSGIDSVAVTHTGHLLTAQVLCYLAVRDTCESWVARHSPSGEPDASFGHGGAVLAAGGVPRSRIVVDAGERVLFSSHSFGIFFESTWITRVGSTSTPIEMLGRINGGPEFLYSPVAVHPDGNPVSLMERRGYGQYALARFAGAALDPSFGGGVARFPAPSEGSLEDLAIAPDGAIVVVGIARLGERRQFVVLRFTPAGVLDTSFGTVGVAYVAGAQPDEAVISARVAIQSDGRVVVAGTVLRGLATSQPYPRIAVARLTTDGKPDGSFAPGGIVDFWRERGAGLSFLALRPDERIVVGGAIWKSYTNGLPTTEAVVLQFAGGDLPTPKPLRERQVIEYFHAGQGHYFVTTDPHEIALLDTDPSRAWTRTSREFPAWVENDGTLFAVCRFWSDQSYAPKSSHFYSPYADECASLKAGSVWRFERDAFLLRIPEGTSGARTCPSGSKPLYRAYNNGQGGAPNHRYTIELALLDQMVAQGWVMEGEAQTKVFACVPR